MFQNRMGDPMDTTDRLFAGIFVVGMTALAIGIGWILAS
jgi:hypothetical protein